MRRECRENSPPAHQYPNRLVILGCSMGTGGRVAAIGLETGVAEEAFLGGGVVRRDGELLRGCARPSVREVRIQRADYVAVCGCSRYVPNASPSGLKSAVCVFA